MPEITQPTGLLKNTWLPEYQTLPGLTANIPGWNVSDFHYPAPPLFAITKVNATVPWENLAARGVTHLQRSVTSQTEFSGVPFQNQYANYQYRTPTGGILPPLSTQQEVNTWIDDNIYVGAGSLDHVYTGEMVENGIGGDQQAEWAYERIYNKIKNAHGIASPAQTNIFGDYGRDSYNAFLMPLWFGKMPGSNTLAVHRTGLSTQANARKKFSGFKTSISLIDTHPYFSAGAQAYRNRMIKYYINSKYLPYNGFVYDLIYGFEKWNVASHLEKTLAYIWTNYEPLNTTIDDKVRRSGLHFETPSGTIYRGSPGMQMSFAHACDLSLISTLLGHGFAAWDESSLWGVDINSWNISSHNPPAYWQPTGGSTGVYSGSVGEPQVVNSGHWWPTAHQAPAENGLYLGRWLVAQVKDRIDTLEYVPFTYSINGGGSQNGYKAGANPQDSGLNYGLPYVSRYGLANAGQHNVVDSFETSKPIAFWGEGSAGYCFFGRNPNALPNQTTTFSINKYGTKTVSVKGSRWAVWTFN